jgi:hypothetical protein
MRCQRIVLDCEQKLVGQVPHAVYDRRGGDQQCPAPDEPGCQIAVPPSPRIAEVMTLVDDYEPPNTWGQMATTHLFVGAKRDRDLQSCSCCPPLRQEHCGNETGGRPAVQPGGNCQGHKGLSTPDRVGE